LIALIPKNEETKHCILPKHRR